MCFLSAVTRYHIFVIFYFEEQGGGGGGFWSNTKINVVFLSILVFSCSFNTFDVKSLSLLMCIITAITPPWFPQMSKQWAFWQVPLEMGIIFLFQTQIFSRVSLKHYRKNDTFQHVWGKCWVLFFDFISTGGFLKLNNVLTAIHVALCKTEFSPVKTSHLVS